MLAQRRLTRLYEAEHALVGQGIVPFHPTLDDVRARVAEIAGPGVTVGESSTSQSLCNPTSRWIRMARWYDEGYDDLTVLHEVTHLVHPDHGPQFVEALVALARTWGAPGLADALVRSYRDHRIRRSLLRPIGAAL